MNAALGSRGKVAETLVKKSLKARSEACMQFEAYRYPDARSGSFQPVPADFEAFGWGLNWLIEVKEVAHDYRLGHTNFTPDAVGRMRKRQLAGSRCVVLVYHSKTRLWRVVPFDLCLTRQGGSWDLRDIPTTNLTEALDNILCPENSPHPS